MVTVGNAGVSNANHYSLISLERSLLSASYEENSMYPYYETLTYATVTRKREWAKPYMTSSKTGTYTTAATDLCPTPDENTSQSR